MQKERKKHIDPERGFSFFFLTPARIEYRGGKSPASLEQEQEREDRHGNAHTHKVDSFPLDGTPESNFFSMYRGRKGGGKKKEGSTYVIIKKRMYYAALFYIDVLYIIIIMIYTPTRELFFFLRERERDCSRPSGQFCLIKKRKTSGRMYNNNNEAVMCMEKSGG